MGAETKLCKNMSNCNGVVELLYLRLGGGGDNGMGCQTARGGSLIHLRYTGAWERWGQPLRDTVKITDHPASNANHRTKKAINPDCDPLSMGTIKHRGHTKKHQRIDMIRRLAQPKPLTATIG